MHEHTNTYHVRASSQLHTLLASLLDRRLHKTPLVSPPERSHETKALAKTGKGHGSMAFCGSMPTFHLPLSTPAGGPSSFLGAAAVALGASVFLSSPLFASPDDFAFFSFFGLSSFSLGALDGAAAAVGQTLCQCLSQTLLQADSVAADSNSGYLLESWQEPCLSGWQAPLQHMQEFSAHVATLMTSATMYVATPTTCQIMLRRCKLCKVFAAWLDVSSL
jgi:hypothetical protein